MKLKKGFTEKQIAVSMCWLMRGRERYMWLDIEGMIERISGSSSAQKFSKGPGRDSWG